MQMDKFVVAPGIKSEIEEILKKDPQFGNALERAIKEGVKSKNISVEFPIKGTFNTYTIRATFTKGTMFIAGIRKKI